MWVIYTYSYFYLPLSISLSISLSIVTDAKTVIVPKDTKGGRRMGDINFQFDRDGSHGREN